MYDVHELQIRSLIENALKEDWSFVDWTTDNCVDEEKNASAKIVCKEPTLTVAGLKVAQLVFQITDSNLTITQKVHDGEEIAKGDVLLTVEGRARSILKGERTALNFLCRLCGIATLTKAFVKEISGTKTRLLDTRKTTPGLRLLEKYAVMVGGGQNHRFCLSDGILIKENHIRAAGGITCAIQRIRGKTPPGLKIECEVTSLQEMREALTAGADIVMLDNMPTSDMKEAVREAAGRCHLEASGNVRLENIKKIAETGVDFVSSGSIIHRASWADLSLLFDIEI